MTEYRIIKIEEYEKEISYFESEAFNNQGGIRFSLDGSLVLLEQESGKFPALTYDNIMNIQEVKSYLNTHRIDWYQEDSLI